jgi:hypothetical protein
MFKNKKFIYLLIPINIAIWSYLSYSIYSGLKGDDLPELGESNKKIKIDNVDNAAKYELNLSYNDPFLREGEHTKKHSARNSSNSNGNNIPKNPPQNTIKTPSVAVVKPQTEIKYLGLVKNNTTGISTALLTINGKSHLVKKGDVIAGISVKNISNETIDLMEGKSNISVSKN